MSSVEEIQGFTGDQATGLAGANGMVAGGQGDGAGTEGGSGGSILPTANAASPAGASKENGTVNHVNSTEYAGQPSVDLAGQQRKPGPKRPRNKNLQPVRQSSRRITKKKWADDQIPEYEINTSKERHKVRRVLPAVFVGNVCCKLRVLWLMFSRWLISFNAQIYHQKNENTQKHGDSSLKGLANKFIDLMNTHHGEVDLNAAAEELGVQVRCVGMVLDRFHPLSLISRARDPLSSCCVLDLP